jgi:hypothetical protein
VQAERNLPCRHVRLHAVAVAFADELLAEGFDFGHFIAFHHDSELAFAGSCQECVLASALAFQERGKVHEYAVGHFVTEIADNRLEVVYIQDEEEQSLARVLMLSDELEVVCQADLVVYVSERVRGNPEF